MHARLSRHGREQSLVAEERDIRPLVSNRERQSPAEGLVRAGDDRDPARERAHRPDRIIRPWKLIKAYARSWRAPVTPSRARMWKRGSRVGVTTVSGPFQVGARWSADPNSGPPSRR